MDFRGVRMWYVLPMDVRVYLNVRGKDTLAQDIKDSKVRAGLVEMGRAIATSLYGVACAEHGRGPNDVRIHIDAKGNGDLRYEACCEALRTLVAKATG
jgi:hypothetical protein